MEPTPAQLAILRQRYPNIGEPALRRNAATLLGSPAPKISIEKVPFTAAMPMPATKRLRQHQGDGMNRWEREYLATLDLQWSHIHREVSLPIANGVRYKVDFLVVSTTNGRTVIEGHEVKGRALSTGVVKIKVAASAYPWIRFILVTKRRKKDGGGWATEPVLA